MGVIIIDIFNIFPIGVCLIGRYYIGIISTYLVTGLGNIFDIGILDTTVSCIVIQFWKYQVFYTVILI